MLDLAKCLILFALLSGIVAFSVKDDLPVLEHLGCDNCERVYAPVCGTDDKSYVNACILNCLNSKRKKEEWVFIKRYGVCVHLSLIFRR